MQFPIRCILGLGLALISFPGSSQNLIIGETPAALSSLRQLNRNSGYIFDGTVLSVQTVAPDETGVATVHITFHIEHAVRGTRKGQVLTIREWAGLWNSGERYRPGERLLLFLYSPGKLGLTSPVGGPLGRFAVDSAGNVTLQEGRLSTLEIMPFRARREQRINARSFALAVQDAGRE